MPKRINKILQNFTCSYRSTLWYTKNCKSNQYNEFNYNIFIFQNIALRVNNAACVFYQNSVVHVNRWVSFLGTCSRLLSRYADIWYSHVVDVYQNITLHYWRLCHYFIYIIHICFHFFKDVIDAHMPRSLHGIRKHRGAISHRIYGFVIEILRKISCSSVYLNDPTQSHFFCTQWELSRRAMCEIENWYGNFSSCFGYFLQDMDGAHRPLVK